MTVSEHNLLIVGASVRAAAASAYRAGLRPHGIDLFADRDLQMVGTAQRIAKYPDDFVTIRSPSPCPFLYTGGLENHPTILHKLQQRHRLWGHAASRPSPSDGGITGILPPLGGGRMLLKPRSSGGGIGIRFYEGQPFDPGTHYLQEYLEGLPCSAVFVGRNDGTADLLGVTQQLIGPAFGAPAFHYVGSVGPLLLSSTTRDHWRSLGNAIVREFHLHGLFGIDAIERDGVPCPVEINPRYTASIEILERACRFHAIEYHRAVFESREIPFDAPTEPTTIWGKAVVYARRNLRYPEAGPWLDVLSGPPADLLAAFGDIPAVGESIQAGQPVLTVFAQDVDVVQCLLRLEESARALDPILFPQ